MAFFWGGHKNFLQQNLLTDVEPNGSVMGRGLINRAAGIMRVINEWAADSVNANEQRRHDGSANKGKT